MSEESVHLTEHVSVRRLTNGPANHFFGYYGINPWNPEQTHHLALEADFHERRPEPADTATVGLVDRESGEFTSYVETHAFNLQQGSVTSWIAAGGKPEFTFNAWDGDRLVSRAVDPATRSARRLDRPLAAVSPDGKSGIGLDFGRMFHCRAVVGYANDHGSIETRPTDDGLHDIDLANGSASLMLSIRDVISMTSAPDDGPAWFNHVVFSPGGERVIFMCRVRAGAMWDSSLWSVRTNGRNLRCEIPFGNWISHYLWLDDETVLVSTDVLGSRGFVTFRLGRDDFAWYDEGVLPEDGHPALSPDGAWLVCDTYPGESDRLSELILIRTRDLHRCDLGLFHSAPHITGDIRCDLHPRWSPDSSVISIDSVDEEDRQIYLVEPRCPAEESE